MLMCEQYDDDMKIIGEISNLADSDPNILITIVTGDDLVLLQQTN
jgi:hypothetical protein